MYLRVSTLSILTGVTGSTTGTGVVGIASDGAIVGGAGVVDAGRLLPSIDSLSGSLVSTSSLIDPESLDGL